MKVLIINSSFKWVFEDDKILNFSTVCFRKNVKLKLSYLKINSNSEIITNFHVINWMCPFCFQSPINHITYLICFPIECLVHLAIGTLTEQGLKLETGVNIFEPVGWGRVRWSVILWGWPERTCRGVRRGTRLLVIDQTTIFFIFNSIWMLVGSIFTSSASLSHQDLFQLKITLLRCALWPIELVQRSLALLSAEGTGGHSALLRCSRRPTGYKLTAATTSSLHCAARCWSDNRSWN